MSSETNSATAINFDVYRCVRTDYFYAECRVCHDICPEEVFYFRDEKLMLKPDTCTGCSACIGGCPSETISLDSFNENQFILQFAGSKDTLLSCKSNTPCPAVFDEHHFAAAVMQKNSSIECDLGQCESCELKNAGEIKKAIETRIDNANAFLEALGIEHRVAKEAKETVSERRGFFKKLTQVAVNQTVLQAPKVSGVDRTATPIPVKKTILKNRLKTWLEEADKEVLDSGFGFIKNKRVDASKCTNCGDCSSFCPTDAFSMDTTKERLFFQLGKCIGCGICLQVCKEECIEEVGSFNLINYAFDRAEKMVEHPLKVCRSCKLAFPAKEGDTECPHCVILHTDFADMFKPASEME